MQSPLRKLTILGLLGLAALSGQYGICQEPTDSATPFPVLQGPYLGQIPPGLKPVRFAPGIISTDRVPERDVAMSPDLTEFYFTRQGKIHWTRFGDGHWTPPEPATFVDEYLSFEPCVTTDNHRLYYISQRPLSGTGKVEPWQIWFVDRQDGSWSEPRRLTTGGEFYPSISQDGFMYVTSADNDLYRGLVTGDALQNLERLSDSINTSADEYNAFIAPGGSYLLLTSFGYGPDYGAGDLYVSFKRPDGSWERPRNLGFGVNTGTREYCPYVSPDGKYLFYSSRRDGSEDIYWVDAGIIQVVRTTDLDLAGSLRKTMEQSGVEAVRAQYAQMQTLYSQYGDFTPHILASVSERLLDAGEVSNAAQAMRLSFELYPEANTEMARLRLTLIESDQAAFDQAAVQLKARAGRLSPAEETALNLLGYDFLRRRDVAGALQIFRLYLELFPQSFNAYDSYGEALLTNADTTAAIVNYRKSLELNPNNTNAAEILKRLGADSVGTPR